MRPTTEMPSTAGLVLTRPLCTPRTVRQEGSRRSTVRLESRVNGSSGRCFRIRLGCQKTRPAGHIRSLAPRERIAGFRWTHVYRLPKSRTHSAEKSFARG